MDLSQAKGKTAPIGETEKASADPFASDIFADSKTRTDLSFGNNAGAKAAAEEKTDWVWRLPKVARPAVNWDDLWRNLPPDFSDELPRLLADSLAGYLNSAGESSIEFLFLEAREASEIAEENNSWWGIVRLENSQTEFAVEIDEGFAVWLVDQMLGAETSDGAPIRILTASEIAVLEFLAVNLTRAANGIINAPLFKFRALDRKNPAWAIRKNASDSNSLLVSAWQTVYGFQQSIIKLYLTPETLKALRADENKLLTQAPRRAALWRSVHNRVKDVRARIFLGEARVTLSDVAALETGDVILPENYGFSISKNNLDGSAEIFLGDGEQVKLAGAFEEFEAESPDEVEETADGGNNESIVRRINSNRALRFLIEYIEELESPQFLEKPMPETNVNLTDAEIEEPFDDAADGGGVPLENLLVTLRVELEARRLSLAEVGNLRVNQIIELGARAADPVNLLIDNKIVARGELVEVDEQLGVRIVQILR